MDADLPKAAIGRGAFRRRELAVARMHALRSIFLDRFADCDWEPPRRVSDAKAVDASTRFVGSHTSVLKARFYQDCGVPEHGIHIVQTCFQAHNLAAYADDSRDIVNGSVFECHGMLHRHGQIGALLRSIDSYLREDVGLGDALCYHVRSEDADLTEACRGALPAGALQMDRLPLERMRHRFGDERLAGRDIRIGVAHRGAYLDCGTIVTVAVDGRDRCIETSLSPGKIVQHQLDLDHYLDVFPIEGVELGDARSSRKAEDCLAGLILLAREGLAPGGSENRRKIMRGQVRHAQNALRAMPPSRLRNLLAKYEFLQYHEIRSADDVTAYVAGAVQPLELGEGGNHYGD